MGNYSENEGSVRVDFFKDSGKWHETVAVDMRSFYCGRRETAGDRPIYLLPDAVIEALRADLTMRRADGTLRYAGCWAVCLDPYHEFSHPQMFRVPER